MAVKNVVKNVAVTNTAVKVGAGAAELVLLQGKPTNGADVWVGDSTVTSTGSTGGFRLGQGDYSPPIPVGDVGDAYVNGTAGDGVVGVAISH